MRVGVESIYNFNIFTKIIIMRYLYSFLFIFVLILFNACEEDEIPASIQTNPTTTPAGDYIVDDCNTWSVGITFSGTNFWSEENGAYFNIDSLHHYCEYYVDTVLMAANGLTVIDLLEEGILDYEVPYMRAEISYPDPGAPANLELTFPGSTGISGTAIDPFQLEVPIEDINSYAPGDVFTYTSCDNYNHWVYGNYDAEYTINFTTVDVVNEQFGGTINIDFSPGGSTCQDLQWWTTYPVGVSEYFTATIDFWFDND
jgi:hypothetical protein